MTISLDPRDALFGVVGDMAKETAATFPFPVFLKKEIVTVVIGTLIIKDLIVNYARQ